MPIPGSSELRAPVTSTGNPPTSQRSLTTLPIGNPAPQTPVSHWEPAALAAAAAGQHAIWAIFLSGHPGVASSPFWPISPLSGACCTIFLFWAIVLPTRFPVRNTNSQPVASGRLRKLLPPWLFVGLLVRGLSAPVLRKPSTLPSNLTFPDKAP